MKKGIIKKAIICGAIIISTALTSLNVMGCEQIDEDLLDNEKYMGRVRTELNANMKIMEMYGDGFNANKTGIVRLRPNRSNKIYVNIDDKVSPRARDNIRQIIDEMNETFSHINDKYNFEECSEEDYIKYRKRDKTTIEFSYDKLEKEEMQGLTTSWYEYKKDLSLKERSYYIYKSVIHFDEERFDKLTNESQLTVIIHEFFHALGFNDIYRAYDDETSLMNTRGGEWVRHFSPNDLKMLYVAYGDKHINKQGQYDQAKMDEIKKIINNYEVKYYEYLMSNIREDEDWPFMKIDEEDLKEQTFNKDGVTFTIKDGMYSYTDTTGQQKTGNLIIGKDYVIVPDIILTSRYNKRTPYNDYFVLLKSDNDLKCYNVDLCYKYKKTLENLLVGELDILVR